MKPLAKNSVETRINRLYIMYEERSINNLQNGVIFLIFKIRKIRNTVFAGNFILSTAVTFITMTSLLWRNLYLDQGQSVQCFAFQFFYNSPTSVKQHCDRVTRKMNVFIKQTYLNAKHCFIFTARCT